MQNEFLASQLNGTLIQNVINVICDQYNVPEQIAQYYRSISIDDALSDDLYNLGLWIGLPWPTASSVVFDGDAFTFGIEADFPLNNPRIGFGDINDPTIGGLFASVDPADTERIPIDKFRILLKAFAYAKYHGITMNTVDVLANVFSDTYEIGFHDWFILGPGDDPIPDEFHGLSDDLGLVGGKLAPDSITAVVDWDVDLIFLNDIGSANLWVIQNVFDVLCTDVQVLCSIDV